MRLSLLALVACATVAHAQSDPCSWITPAQLTKELGVKQPYAAPQKSEAIPAYRGQNPGTNCVFSGSPGVRLVVYTDRSAAEAKQTFESMMGSFYKVASKPSDLGDEAYFDTRHGLHVLKGKTRFFLEISLSDHTAAEQHAHNLAMMALPNA